MARGGGGARWPSVLLPLLLALQLGRAMIFKVPVGESQCVNEDVAFDIMVYSDYNVTVPHAGVHVALKVTVVGEGRPDKVIVDKQDVQGAKGIFAFTSDASEQFTICFATRVDDADAGAGGEVDVRLDVRTGVDAKDYSGIAKKEHLGVLEVELKKLEGEVQEVMDEMVYMRHREESMRNTNESTNARVLWFSVFSVAVLVTTAAWQIYHLKHYFKRKKLI